MPQITLVPFEQLQTFMELEDSEEGIINMLSFSATTEIENHTHRILYEREIGEFHDGYNQNSIELKEYPVTEVNRISIRQFTKLCAFIPLESEAYTCQTQENGFSTIFLQNNYSFPKGQQNIKVLYTAGYNSETLPDDLQMAVCETVSWLYKRMKARQIGVTQLVDERNRASRFTYDKTLPDHVREILEPYRKKEW